MANWKIKLSLFLNYFVFAILLNSVGTVILQVQGNYGISESSASILEAFKDLTIAGVSFLVASYIVRIGYKNSMLIAIAFVTVACLLMATFPSFGMTKLLFAAVGASFALIKVSVYATWAPLQWMAFKGLQNYGFTDLANQIKTHWLNANTKIYEKTGKMTEKYNVFNQDLEAGGGEYPLQDGFGWTNGVFLALSNS